MLVALPTSPLMNQCCGWKVIWATLALLCAAFAGSTDALTFYVPVPERGYERDAPVPVMVNSLRSLKSVFPYDYYSLPFCKPDNLTYEFEIIGQTLYGEKIASSSYQLNMLRNVSCMPIPNCGEENAKLLKEKVDLLETRIEQGYRGFLSIDNLPAFNNGTAAQFGKCRGRLPQSIEQKYLRGYALGVTSSCMPDTLINNHLQFRILFNHYRGDKSSNKFSVVGFSVAPYSVDHEAVGGMCDSNFNISDALTPISTRHVRSDRVVQWTYGVTWEYREDIPWRSRWNEYLMTSRADREVSLHWIYITVVFLMVLLCASAVSVILLRAVRRDFARYNSTDPEDLQEDFGWKLVHADVFRVPYYAEYLAIFAGTGIQLLSLFASILLFASMGFFSPSRRGSLVTHSVLVAFLTSLIGGYTCGVLLKYFHKREWRYVFLFAFGFPGIIFAVYIFINIINRAYHSTDAVPMGLMVFLISMWLLVSVPLSVLGASYAFHQNPIENPVQVGRIARDIPEQHFMNTPTAMYLISPIFPLATVMFELHYILEAFWLGQVYYVFGFLTLVFILWLFVSALVTVFNIYYILCHENHQWWWSSAMIPGCMGLHFFVITVYYFLTNLSFASFASAIIYFLLMGLLALSYGLAASAVGLISSIVFVRIIYSNIKVD